MLEKCIMPYQNFSYLFKQNRDTTYAFKKFKDKQSISESTYVLTIDIPWRKYSDIQIPMSLAYMIYSYFNWSWQRQYGDWVYCVLARWIFDDSTQVRIKLKSLCKSCTLTIVTIAIGSIEDQPKIKFLHVKEFWILRILANKH